MQQQRRTLARLAAAAALAGLVEAAGASGQPAAAQDGLADAPRILSATIVPEPIHAGEQVEADVVASPNVASVDAHVRGVTIPLQEVRAGEFRVEKRVPKIARFFKGTYHVTFVAHAGDRTAESSEDVVLN